jgi:hypothetical protein
MKRYIKKKSQKQEARTAKEFRGLTQPASGALSGAKGDVRTGQRDGDHFNEDDFLIENKFTDEDFYKLDLRTWAKINEEAIRDNFRTPLMQIDIQDVSCVVVDYNYFIASVEPQGQFTFDFEDIKTKSVRIKKSQLEVGLAFAYKNGYTYALQYDFADYHLVVMGKADFLDLVR